MGRSTSQEQALSETRKYRKFSAQQKSELVLASLRGRMTIAEICREHDISETLLRRWREQFLAAGQEDLGARGLGGTLAGLGVTERVARSERAGRCRSPGRDRGARRRHQPASHLRASP